MFQTWSVITTVLDSVASITTYYSPVCPNCLSCFLDRFISLLPFTAPSSVAFLLYYIYIPVTPAPHLLSQCGTLSTCTLPTPVTLQPQMVVSTPRAACLIISPHPASFCPHLLAPGGARIAGTSISLVSLHLTPCVILRFLSYYGSC